MYFRWLGKKLKAILKSHRIMSKEVVFLYRMSFHYCQFSPTIPNYFLIVFSNISSVKCHILGAFY